MFVRYRANVTQLRNHLARHSAADGVKAHAFVGRSRRADLRGGGAAGMDQAEQLRVLRQFRGGEFNVLVATSVAEEGLDIGEVDLIVCFDSVTSPIRLMQRFGRTGRKMDGRCVLLLTQKEGREYRATIDAAERLAAELRYGSRVDMRPNAKFEPLPREMPPPQRRDFDPDAAAAGGDAPTHPSRPPRSPRPRAGRRSTARRARAAGGEAGALRSRRRLRGRRRSRKPPACARRRRRRGRAAAARTRRTRRVRGRRMGRRAARRTISRFGSAPPPAGSAPPRSDRRHRPPPLPPPPPPPLPPSLWI